MSESVKLSIGLFCHNHEAFVRQALEGILSQDAGIVTEVLVMDDASSDATLEIVRSFAQSRPEIIIHRSEVQQGPVKQARWFTSEARGEYMCWLDADDYWNEPSKIRRQLAFLDSQPEYAGCFHDAQIVSEIPDKETDEEYKMRCHSQWRTYSQINHYKEDYFAWDAVMRRIIPTASLVFRRPDFTDFFSRFNPPQLSLAWAVHLWLLMNSRFRYFNEIWSVYLDRPQGFSKHYPLKTFKVNNIAILERFLEEPYYQGIKRDVFRGLVQEYYHLLSLPVLQIENGEELNQYLKRYKHYSNELRKADLKWFSAVHRKKG